VDVLPPTTTEDLPCGQSAGSSSVRVSVIVPTRNRLDELDRLLGLLEEQTLPRDSYEVIVADDGSSDSLDGLAARWPRIRISSGPPRNSYAARNRAARLAHAPVLAFCDTDCEPVTTWLEAGLAALERADLAAGRVRFLPPPVPTLWALLDIDMFLDQERTVPKRQAATANLFVGAGLFGRVGGFREEFASGGDYEFVGRCIGAGGSLTFAPGAVVGHPTRDTGRSFFSKTWRIFYRSRPRRPGLRTAIPFHRSVRDRRRAGRPIGLDSARLEANGARATPVQRAAALVVVHAAVPWLRFVAELANWLRSRIASRG
jgi:glycosyltransferase involved in cell wall biosynthesis